MRKHPLLALATAVSTASLSLIGAFTSVGASTTGQRAATVHHARRHHKIKHHALSATARRRRARARLEARALKKEAARAAVQHQPAATHHAFVPLGGVWAQLRACESGGNYQENTGNGYYGAYQFSLGTWHALGVGGIPSAAAPAVQDAMALKLQSQRGWEPWPNCSWELHLS